MDNFTYLGSSVSSTENDFRKWQAKAWSTINRLSIVRKSDLNKIKRIFFANSGCVNSTIWMHNVDADEAYKEKAWREMHKKAKSYIEQILGATSPPKQQLYGYLPPISKTI